MGYSTSWTKIGNSAGFRIAGQFFKDNPQFAGTTGEVEVVDSATLLVRLNSQDLEQAEDEQMLSLFLVFLTKQALANSEKEIETYIDETINELYRQAGMKEPLVFWWIFIPGLNLVVGLRQIHFLSEFWAKERGIIVKDAIAESVPFLSTNA